jgi:predicted MFS family arabinose efflux permease
LLGAVGVASASLGRPPMAMVVTAAAVASLGVITLALVRSFAFAVAVLMVTGVAQIVFTSSVNSTVQITVPDGMRGRMMSLYVLVFVGVTPLGAFLTGALAETFGVAVACGLGGGAGLLAVLVLAWTWHRSKSSHAA